MSEWGIDIVILKSVENCMSLNPNEISAHFLFYF